MQDLHGGVTSHPRTKQEGNAAPGVDPRRFRLTTAMTFPGLRSKKDIDDVIAYITGANEPGGAGLGQ